MSAAQPQLITRNRERLACTECRRRKLRCDRTLPCSSCVRRGSEAACTFQRFTNGTEYERERRLQAETRLGHLEHLVQQLAARSENSAPASGDPSTSSSQRGLEWMEVDQGQNVASEAAENGTLLYSGATHWSAMLDDIQELRFTMNPDDPFNPDDTHALISHNEHAGLELIFSAKSPTSLGDVLSRFLPSRSETDRLISAYFRARAIAAPFIHATQFRRQYQAFWNNPAGTPPLWISILFSICHIASNTLRLNQDGESMANKYSVAAAHCLAIGRYFRSQRLSVESLLVFVQAQCLTSLTISSDIGTIFGLLVRLATQSGYHRDPDAFKLKPFEKEMRRRTWSLCMQLDLLISFHLGLPSNIQFPTWDTRPPRNLLDSDFDEDSEELPPDRPDLEFTEILFYTAKHKFMVVFEKILRHSLATEPDVDRGSEVDALDSEIRSVYEALPEMLRPRTMDDSIVDPAFIIVTRLCVSFIHLKCLCVLHRPYITKHRVKSIRICYEAAVNLVRSFVNAYYEFRPGGQAETERWFMSSLTWHDFLLGLTVICLVLCVTSQSDTPYKTDEAAILALLEKAQTVCSEQAVTRRNRETMRVSSLLDATILRFGSRGSKTLKSGSSEVEPTGIHGIQAHQRNDAWAWDENVPGQVDDASWSYLEQFLNLPNGYLMGD